MIYDEVDALMETYLLEAGTQLDDIESTCSLTYSSLAGHYLPQSYAQNERIKRWLNGVFRKKIHDGWCSLRSDHGRFAEKYEHVDRVWRESIAS